MATRTSEIKGKTFGTGKVEYGEDERGYLICHTDGTEGECYTASRDWSGIPVAVRAVTMGDYDGMDISRVGVSFYPTSVNGQEVAVADLIRKETEAQIERHWFEGDLTEEQTATLQDELGHLPLLPLENQVKAYHDLGQKAYELARVSR